MKRMNLKWLALVMAILVSVSMISCSKSDSSSSAGSASSSSGSASPSVSEAPNAWDKLLDDYEKLVDEYVAMMAKYQEDNDFDLMLKALDILNDSNKVLMQINDGAAQLSLAQANRLTRIAKKLL